MSEVITCTRRFEWDAGHRVLGHKGKCRHLHGHRYVAEVMVEAPKLNDLGMVADFALLKEVIGEWIDRHWDHNMMLHQDDPLLKLHQKLVEEETTNEGIHFVEKDLFGGCYPYVMPDKMNPTAENIALVLLRVSQELLSNCFKVKYTKVFETPNCFAEAFKPF